MKNYYFTFGQSHFNNEGQNMKNYWVRVVASSYMSARLLFTSEFSSLRMPSPDKWAFQYTDEDWDPSYFFGGEYMLITEHNSTTSASTIKG